MAKVAFAERIRNIFRGRRESEAFFEELSDSLIEGDVGARTAFEIAGRLEDVCRKNRLKEEREIVLALKEILLGYVKSVSLRPDSFGTNIWMILGVNGVGKTTSAAKLADFFKRDGVGNILFASADTFRAAAIEQLSTHAERLGIRAVSHQHGSDPAAVIFDAAEASRAKGPGLVLADTAGRLHNKENLVRELQKIDRICREKASEGCCKKILVIDATTGQNALRQAEVFSEAVGIDALILSKYDSTAKGGIAVSVGKELGLPFAFVCTGERYGDIRAFDADSYVSDFLGI